jgi:hypothetical protein
MKKNKSKKGLRKAGRPAREPVKLPVYTEEEFDSSQEVATLINTFFTSVVRNVHNGLITIDDTYIIAMALPQMILRSYHPHDTCDRFCQMIKFNWPRAEPYYAKDYSFSRHIVIEQSKTYTMDDGV